MGWTISSSGATGKTGATLNRRGSARALTALAAVAALALAGCSGTATKPKPTSSPTPGNSFLAYDKQLTVALVSCFYRLHLIPKHAAEGPPPLPVHDGQVATSTPTDLNTILVWFAGVGQGLSVEGVSMGAWLGNSAQEPDDWPTSKCGKIPPPSS
jgi:hypothetical protein